MNKFWKMRAFRGAAGGGGGEQPQVPFTDTCDFSPASDDGYSPTFKPWISQWIDPTRSAFKYEVNSGGLYIDDYYGTARQYNAILDFPGLVGATSYRLTWKVEHNASNGHSVYFGVDRKGRAMGDDNTTGRMMTDGVTIDTTGELFKQNAKYICFLDVSTAGVGFHYKEYVLHGETPPADVTTWHLYAAANLFTHSLVATADALPLLHFGFPEYYARKTRYGLITIDVRAY